MMIEGSHLNVLEYFSLFSRSLKPQLVRSFKKFECFDQLSTVFNVLSNKIWPASSQSLTTLSVSHSLFEKEVLSAEQIVSK